MRSIVGIVSLTFASFEGRRHVSSLCWILLERVSVSGVVFGSRSRLHGRARSSFRKYIYIISIFVSDTRDDEKIDDSSLSISISSFQFLFPRGKPFN